MQRQVQSRIESKRTTGSKWMAIRERVLRITPHCVECYNQGKVTPAQEIDHIIPLFKGGTDDMDNLQALCQSHHADKTRADLGQRPKVEIGLDGWPVEVVNSLQMADNKSKQLGGGGSR
jgi:5-methylcytosine-specific restriction protein A